MLLAVDTPADVANWPSAAMWITLIIAVAACFIVWRITGGKFYGED